MKSQLFSLVLSAALTATLVGVPVMYSEDAGARSFSRSSGGSFSRSTFRSAPSFKGSNSHKSGSKSGKSPSLTGGFWQKSGSGTKTGNKSLKTGGSKQGLASGGRVGNKTKHAVNIHKQQNKFKKPVSVPGIKTKAGAPPPSRKQVTTAYRDKYRNDPLYRRASAVDSSTYYQRRNSYYGAGYEPPIYVYNSPPSFGLLDTMFLYSMMSHANSAQYAYHNQNNADYRAWRAEADEQAKTNAELQAQLAAIDLKVAAMQGTPIQEGYLPEGVDADIALAQGARMAALPDLKVCTGGTDGAYFAITTGVMAPHSEYANIVPVVTAGSGQALDYLSTGKCDAAWVQANGYWNYVEEYQTTNLPFTKVFPTSPFREAVHVMCNEKSGLSKVSQMSSKYTMLFPKGSGAETTMLDWIGENDDYGDIKSVINDPKLNVTSYDDAMLKVSQDKNACLMYVAAKGSTKFMKNADKVSKTMKTVLIDVTDSDLDDTTDPSGDKVYSSMQIDSSVHPKLTRQSGSWFGSGDVHTYDVGADFLISDAWKKKNAGVYGKMAIQFAGMAGDIKRFVK